jgi:hypothetical protein
MAYKNFTLSKLKDKLGVNPSFLAWLEGTYPGQEPTPFLLNDLKEAANEALDSEKAKSEMIIAPMIKELKRHNPNRFGFYSGYELNVDKALELRGFCDFILSTVANTPLIESPIFCLVEAKKGEIEEGFGQCGAEMFAAWLFNERKGTPRRVVYGCVTNAFTWCFLKLEGKELRIDPNYVPLTFIRPHEVLGVLQSILDRSLAPGA